MNIGDIIKTTQDYRSIIQPQFQAGSAGELIVLRRQAREDGLNDLVHYLNSAGRADHMDDSWLELVHELHTAEARAIHEAYPQHQGHDYYWYCEQRNVEPFRTPEELTHIGMQAEGAAFETEDLTLAEQGYNVAREPGLEAEQVDAMLEELVQAGFDAERVANAEPLGWEQWQRGDVLSCVDDEFCENICEGREYLVDDVDTDNAELSVNALDGESILSGHRYEEYRFEFVRRPAVAVAATLSWEHWLPGDVLERINNALVFNGITTRVGDFVLARDAAESQANIHVTSLTGEQAGGMMCENLRFVRRPVAAAPVLASTPATQRALQVGDRVQLVGIVGTTYSGESWNGQQGILTALPIYEGACAQITRDSGLTQTHYLTNMELVTAVPAEDLSAVPASAWRVGDTVRRVAMSSETSYGELDGEYTILNDANNYGTTGLTYTNAHDGGGWFVPSVDLVLVRRSGTPAPELPASSDGLPRNTDIGARVLIHWPGNSSHGKAASIMATRSSNYCVIVDGNDGNAVFTAAQLRLLLTEPAMPAYRAGSHNNVWLDLEGATKEDCDAFITELANYGISTRQNAGNSFGSQSEGPRNHLNGRRVGLFIEGRSAYYYWRTSYNHAGSLLRDWNSVLRELKHARGRGFVLSGITPAAPVKNHGLAKLPHYFILESTVTGNPTTEGMGSWLLQHGFTGFVHQYSLFSGSSVVGTSLKGAAEAFQAKHQAVWLHAETDRVLISTLFNQRKNMLTTSAAQQRFALDVDASGPHLIVAFKAFMASIGYRQQNPAKDSGPYILLNGGNIFANQPATWQYSEVKNNRNALINLAEPAVLAGNNPGTKSGWEKLGERLANRGVALPVLDAEDLDRSPIAGDKVCLVFNDVRDGYPETDADLRSHTCGQQYKVGGMVRGLCMISETGLLLHPDRLQVLETPRGLQNGDQVMLSANYGEHLVLDQVMTLMNGLLVAADNTAYAVPVGMYKAVTPELLTQNLLRRYGMTLPCVVKVTNTLSHEYGNEQIISTAWPLNNQELAFWTEDTQDKDSWYERADFQVVTATSVPDLFQPAWRVLKGATRETTVVQIGELQISLAQLEDALAA